MEIGDVSNRLPLHIVREGDASSSLDLEYSPSSEMISVNTGTDKPKPIPERPFGEAR
jgi:hypothetical protein